MEDDRSQDGRPELTDTINPDGPTPMDLTHVVAGLDLTGIPLGSEVGKVTHESGMPSISDFNSLDRFTLPISPMTDVGTGHHPQEAIFTVDEMPAPEWETATTCARFVVTGQNEPPTPDGDGWEPFASGVVDGVLFTRWRRRVFE